LLKNSDACLPAQREGQKGHQEQKRKSARYAKGIQNRLRERSFDPLSPLSPCSNQALQSVFVMFTLRRVHLKK
jgi:hypothetical protein